MPFRCLLSKIYFATILYKNSLRNGSVHNTRWNTTFCLVQHANTLPNLISLFLLHRRPIISCRLHHAENTREGTFRRWKKGETLRYHKMQPLLQEMYSIQGKEGGEKELMIAWEETSDRYERSDSTKIRNWIRLNNYTLQGTHLTLLVSKGV